MTLGSISTPSKPIISTRKGIAWGLNPPSEDSSVLVLTSPERYYIDIRFALEGSPTSGPFWAFAGKVKYTPLETTSSSSLSNWSEVGMRGEWNHPIDSMGNNDGIDKADLFELANTNGDQIEIGLLENPETGKEDRFIEYWTKPDNFTSGSIDGRYAVAKLEDNGILIGLAIRIGDFAQGIKSVEGGVVVERWSRLDSQWKRDERSNAEEDQIPMKWFLGVEDGSQSIFKGGQRWFISEFA